MARPLPQLADPIPYSYNSSLARVREYVEQVTGPDPTISIGYEVFQVVHEWATNSDYLPIIEQILKSRLGLEWPCNHKALILVQALPPSSLPNLIDQLTPLSSSEIPFIAQMASNLLKSGEEVKGKEAGRKESQKKQFDWDVWGEVYGRPECDWPRLPTEIEWGVWGIPWVSSESWWNSAANQEND